MTVDADISGRPRTLEENQAWMRKRLQTRIHPFDTCDPAATLAVIDSLTGLDGETWGTAWMAAGDKAAAANDWVSAHAYYFIGRFPTPNHPKKLESAQKERDAYLNVAERKAWDMKRIVIPFAGRADEGKEIAFYYRRPTGVRRPPVVAIWGGIDAWKEQLTAQVQAFLDAGFATIAVDNVGTGESPLAASIDGERQFYPLMDWARAQPDLDGEKIGLFGRSFGGYWATKLAHLVPERITGAVSWAGGAHHMYQREWIEASRFPDSYLMDLAEARGRMLGAADDAGYIERFAALSLIDQGILEKPCAPLLLCNGKYDKQVPIDDIFILLDHGSPKSVRFFPGGHMGHGPDTVPTMVHWLKEQTAK